MIQRGGDSENEQSAHAWEEGIRVAPGNVIAPGIAIATFVNGRYPNDRTGQHAAVFVAYAGASLWIIDQWIGLKAVQMRLIRPVLRGGSRGADGRYPDASNNPAAFSVIER